MGERAIMSALSYKPLSWSRFRLVNRNKTSLKSAVTTFTITTFKAKFALIEALSLALRSGVGKHKAGCMYKFFEEISNETRSG
jgi:hypothetical protein